jgi:TolB protein
MRHPIPRLLTLLLTSSATLLVAASAVPSASQQDPQSDNIGLILFTSDRANPSLQGQCTNCEDIYIMAPEADPLGTNATRLTFGGGARLDPSAYNSGGADWSNQKQLIAFHSNRVNLTPQIFLMQRDGSEPQMLVSLTGGAAFPSFSHNGNQLCFHGQATPRQIYIVNVNGTELIDLTGPQPGEPAATGSNIRCDWAPKGNAIAFTSDRDGDQDIYVIKPDGTGLRQLTNENGSDANPAFSPKGDLIAFESNRTGSPEIWVMNSDGSDPEPLTVFAADPRPSSYSVTKPTWSPKGDRISFHRRVLGPTGPGKTGHFETFTMDADGGNVTRITFTGDPGFSGFPSWGKWSTVEGASPRQ